jgi:hypothetical protein
MEQTETGLVLVVREAGATPLRGRPAQPLYLTRILYRYLCCTTPCRCIIGGFGCLPIGGTGTYSPQYRPSSLSASKSSNPNDRLPSAPDASPRPHLQTFSVNQLPWRDPLSLACPGRPCVLRLPLICKNGEPNPVMVLALRMRHRHASHDAHRHVGAHSAGAAHLSLPNARAKHPPHVNTCSPTRRANLPLLTISCPIQTSSEPQERAFYPQVECCEIKSPVRSLSCPNSCRD